MQGVCLPRFQNLTDPLHSELHAGAESHVSLSHNTELSEKYPQPLALLATFAGREACLTFGLESAI